ncbi:HNH endonuclease signature motif containing protein [Rhodococcus sp. NPDC079359]
MWYVDGIANSEIFINKRRVSYGHVYAEVRTRLSERYPSGQPSEISVAAQVVADVAWRRICIRKEAQERGVLSRGEKAALWFAAEPSPRCYLCGYLFTGFARDKFLKEDSGGANRSLVLPALVDFTRPRRTQRDHVIEIDHVEPVALGGTSGLSNLRLACGWCNRVKSARTSIYDVGAATDRVVNVSGIGWVREPQSFWVLRVVATRGICEASIGCSRTVEDSELVVAPRYPAGAMNPTNIAVYCDEHDPWRSARLVGI